MTTLTVIATAPGSSVQDCGRLGHRRFGVSVAGAMDHGTLALANALVGNSPEAAALEIPYSGGSYRVADGPILATAAGPGVTMEIAGRRIGEYRAAHAAPGDVIKVSPVRNGVYAYLAIAGGIKTEPELGSRSLHLRSGIGGRMVQPGDRLPCQSGAVSAPVRVITPPPSFETGPIRAVPGPQADHFTTQARNDLFSAAFKISRQSDRMGIRLGGPQLKHAHDYNILSDGVVAGSVQVPGDGQPIVLMRDCQTTGGYPKIATVISADLDRLAQSSPGQKVTFAEVTVEEALEAARTAARRLAAYCAAVRPVADFGDSHQLLSLNLISGVVHGEED